MRSAVVCHEIDVTKAHKLSPPFVGGWLCEKHEAFWMMVMTVSVRTMQALIESTLSG